LVPRSVPHSRAVAAEAARARKLLVWQGDGNLGAYDNASANAAGDAVFSSGTAGRGARLSFQVDGNMVVYDRYGRALWASGASNDRNARTYY
jgi:hypothetical protein